jgi:hypothetical protein
MAMLAGMARPKRLHLLTGRPSRYTIEVATEILTRMAEGGSLHRICQDEHLPAAATVRDWPTMVGIQHLWTRSDALGDIKLIAGSNRPLRSLTNPKLLRPCRKSAPFSFVSVLYNGQLLGWRRMNSAIRCNTNKP